MSTAGPTDKTLPGREHVADAGVGGTDHRHVERQAVRTTATKVLRSDDLIANEKEIAAGILRANPELGNPHVVRCDWCRDTRTLFRDENDGPFERTANGWRCASCDIGASSQEVNFGLR